MSTERLYRFSGDCDCLGCKVAAVLNAHQPEGFTAEDLLTVAVGMSVNIAAALTVNGAASMTVPAMTETLAAAVVEPWKAMQ